MQLDIPTIDYQDSDRIRQQIESDTAFLSRIPASTWQARDWTFDFFTQHYGKQTVTPLVGLPRSGQLEKSQEHYQKEMDLESFLSLIQQENLIAYLGYLRVEDLDKKLLEAIHFSHFTQSSSATDTRLWIGSKNTHSGLHSDLKDNFFLQISGQKTLYLVPFADTRYVYPCDDNIVNSQIDPSLDTDTLATQFPLFNKARIAQLTLQAGDIIFIPKGWWHCFISDSPSISVNHWFGDAVTSRTYMQLIAQQGPRYIAKTLADTVRYGIFKRKYTEDFFFTPPPNGKRVMDFLLRGNFSSENNPTE